MKISRRGLAKWLFGAAAVGAVAKIPTRGPVNPPLIVPKGILRSDVDRLYAGGITWVDTEYNERLGEAEYAARWRRLGSV